MSNDRVLKKVLQNNKKTLDKKLPKCYNKDTKKERTKEITTMMHIDYDTYELICDLLAEGDELAYSVEEIAEMTGVSVETVQYVDRAEHDDL